MRDILHKYFRDNRLMYFHPADLIADEHYLAYEYVGERVILSIGSNEGETTLKVFNPKQADELEQLIKLLIY